MRGLPSIEALESVHTFPGPYTFKVFGPGESDVMDATRDVALSFVDESGLLGLKARESSRGTYVCVSVTVECGSAEVVRQIYRSLVRLESVRYLL